MKLKHPNFGSLYLFIKRNSDIVKANNGFRLVDEFCANHNLDPVTLKEVCFYFGANSKGILGGVVLPKLVFFSGNGVVKSEALEAIGFKERCY